MFTFVLYFVYKLHNKVKAPGSKTRKELEQIQNNKQAFFFAKSEASANLKIKKFAFTPRVA